MPCTPHWQIFGLFGTRVCLFPGEKPCVFPERAAMIPGLNCCHGCTQAPPKKMGVLNATDLLWPKICGSGIFKKWQVFEFQLELMKKSSKQNVLFCFRPLKALFQPFQGTNVEEFLLSSQGQHSSLMAHSVSNCYDARWATFGFQSESQVGHLYTKNGLIFQWPFFPKKRHSAPVYGIFRPGHIPRENPEESCITFWVDLIRITWWLLRFSNQTVKISNFQWNLIWKPVPTCDQFQLVLSKRFRWKTAPKLVPSSIWSFKGGANKEQEKAVGGFLVASSSDSSAVWFVVHSKAITSPRICWLFSSRSVDDFTKQLGGHNGSAKGHSHSKGNSFGLSHFERCVFVWDPKTGTGKLGPKNGRTTLWHLRDQPAMISFQRCREIEHQKSADEKRGTQRARWKNVRRTSDSDDGSTVASRDVARRKKRRIFLKIQDWYIWIILFFNQDFVR